ncbi:MAG: MFS transporter [Acidobacteriota bacterium]
MAPVDSPLPAAAETPQPPPSALGRRNLWAVGLASFFTDVSSEMVLHLLPLYLAGTLGASLALVGLIEGGAKALASLLKIASGGMADRLGHRKWLAVAGYGLSTAAKPFFALATAWPGVLAARWGERVGKGVRTAPRDALLAASVPAGRRGLAFGLHRAADTAGAVVGLGIAIAVIVWLGGARGALDGPTFRTLVWISLVPAGLGVVALALLAREPGDRTPARSPKTVPATDPTPRLGRAFWSFLAIAALFELGDSSDAFLVLRAADVGLSTVEILGALLAFNVVYALASAPAGRWSDRVGRRQPLALGWLLHAGVYGGLAVASHGSHVAVLIALYGLHRGLTHGVARAWIADLVPASRRGLAYGVYAGTIGVLDVPASVLAGVLWQGAFGWGGWGAGAAFGFGAMCATLATVLLLGWRFRATDVSPA